MNTLQKVLVALVVILGFALVGNNFRSINVIVKAPESFTAGGTTAGTDFTSPFLNFNGISHFYAKTGFYTASSTLCAVKSPSVDSRLEHVSTNFFTTPSYATSYQVAWGTTINATTTSIIANTQLSYVASATNQTSVGSSTSSTLIPANSWVMLAYSTSTGANVAGSGYAPTGRCELEFVGL